MATIESIEGIGPANGASLREAGVRTVEGLLKQAGAKAGRRALAKETGINEKMILGWANRADLMRIKGVSTQYSDLLEVAGVDSVKELARRRADNLTKAMVEANDKATAKGGSIVRRPPSLPEVERWIDQAKSMDAVITH